ncbi:MAG: nucleotidyltransferase [Clostridiaceae bacterium]|nr:nucleotidyltransferase [Clostridiaceae bacterium]
MFVAGIIAVYNPLHEGHLFHFNKTLKETGADFAVCILSSNFVQRGEPSIVNKWARTRMALDIGVDLVIELPSAFSCASAEYFASAAVRILDSLNCVDYLCFGSEEGKIQDLESTAEFLANESEEFKIELKKGMDKGLSFAAARQRAIISCKNVPDNIGSILNKPNNILGVEYIKAIKRLGSSIKPVTIKRQGQDYNSIELAASFSSATSIRHHLAETVKLNSTMFETDTFINSNLPKSSLEIIKNEINHGRGPVFSETFEIILFHLLRQTPLSELKKLPYVAEGLENRLKDAAMNSISLLDLISKVVTSRYPTSRIKRILCALLTGLSAELLEELKTNGYAQYIKILGFNEKGRILLNKIKKSTDIPIITQPASYTKLSNPLAIRLFEHEIRSNDTYVLAYPDAKQRIGGSELRSRPLYI